MFCEHCGSRLEAGQSVCTTCGQSVPVDMQRPAPRRQSAPQPKPRTRQKSVNPRWEAIWQRLDEEKSKKTALITGGVLGGICLLVLLIGYT